MGAPITGALLVYGQLHCMDGKFFIWAHCRKRLILKWPNTIYRDTCNPSGNMFGKVTFWNGICTYTQSDMLEYFIFWDSTVLRPLLDKETFWNCMCTRFKVTWWCKDKTKSLVLNRGVAEVPVAWILPNIALQPVVKSSIGLSLMLVFSVWCKGEIIES